LPSLVGALRLPLTVLLRFSKPRRVLHRYRSRLEGPPTWSAAPPWPTPASQAPASRTRASAVRWSALRVLRLWPVLFVVVSSWPNTFDDSGAPVASKATMSASVKSDKVSTWRPCHLGR
jgi:hypothetical protein